MADTTPSEQSTRPVVRLINLLDQLEAQGLLTRLYQAGVVGLAVYTQREIYNYYHALLSSPSYTDRPHKAALATAEGCTRVSVYQALRIMEQQMG
jgi:hypothetical protein